MAGTSKMACFNLVKLAEEITEECTVVMGNSTYILHKGDQK
jgi:hypothetical protein